MPTRTISPQPVDMNWITGRLDALQEHMDGRFDNLEERLRHVEVGEAGCRGEWEGKMSNLETKVTTIEQTGAQRSIG